MLNLFLILRINGSCKNAVLSKIWKSLFYADHSHLKIKTLEYLPFYIKFGKAKTLVVSRFFDNLFSLIISNYISSFWIYINEQKHLIRILLNFIEKLVYIGIFLIETVFNSDLLLSFIFFFSQKLNKFKQMIYNFILGTSIVGHRRD